MYFNLKVKRKKLYLVRLLYKNKIIINDATKVRECFERSEEITTINYYQVIDMFVFSFDNNIEECLEIVNV